MMRLRWFVIGVFSSVVIALVAGGLILLSAHGFSASEQPTEIERWLARCARSAALPSDAAGRVNPVPKSPEVLAEARAHWADHCAICHANDGSGDTAIGRHTYPQAPDMRLPATQRMSDGQLFYVIQNGIRLTAMPAWGGGSDHDAQDSWKLVHFVRHLPDMTVEEKAEMAKLNPKSPRELKEEADEEEFLKGNGHDQPMEHHHH